MELNWEQEHTSALTTKYIRFYCSPIIAFLCANLYHNNLEEEGEEEET